MRSAILLVSFVVFLSAQIGKVPEFVMSSEDFVNDSATVIDSTYRFEIFKDSYLKDDPNYVITYINKKGKRRYYKKDAFAVRIDGKYYIQEKSIVFGPSQFRPITRCENVSYYSFITKDTYSQTRDKDDLTTTWYIIYMEDEGMIKPLTSSRVRELLIRNNPVLYNEFSMTGPHSVEKLLNYIDRLCK